MEYRNYVGNQKFDMKVKNVKYTYCDKAYRLGPFIDILAELEVENTGYDTIGQCNNDSPDMIDVAEDVVEQPIKPKKVELVETHNKSNSISTVDSIGIPKTPSYISGLSLVRKA